MAAHAFTDPCTTADLFFVAPIFDPGVAEGGVAVTAGASPVDVDRVETFLEQAEARTDRDLWGTDKSPWAVCYLAAHLIYEDVVANATNPAPSSSAGIGYAGPVTSESVDGISRSFGGSGGTGFVAGGSKAYEDEELATTPWGKKLIQLRTTIARIGMV